jgi:hypothetical protein
MHKTQNKKTRKKYRKSWQQAIQAFNDNPFRFTLPESEIQRWLIWAESRVLNLTPKTTELFIQFPCLIES